MGRLLLLTTLSCVFLLIQCTDQQSPGQVSQGSQQNSNDVPLPGQNMINSGMRKNMQKDEQGQNDVPLRGQNMINSSHRRGMKTGHGTAPNRKRENN